MHINKQSNTVLGQGQRTMFNR